MKDYLKDELSVEEKAFINGIIEKTALKFIRNFIKIKEKESLSIDDESVSEEILGVLDNYDFIDKILENRILRDISRLTPYSQYEKEKIVETLENIAKESDLREFIKPLTFNEKLVVFLLYMENYQVNEVARLLGASRMAIWRRDKSIKNKISEVKEKMKNGRS